MNYRQVTPVKCVQHISKNSCNTYPNECIWYATTKKHYNSYGEQIKNVKKGCYYRRRKYTPRYSSMRYSRRPSIRVSRRRPSVRRPSIRYSRANGVVHRTVQQYPTQHITPNKTATTTVTTTVFRHQRPTHRFGGSRVGSRRNKQLFTFL